VPRRAVAAAALALVAGVAVAWGQGPDFFVDSPDNPAIEYSSGPVRNPVADLNRRIADGSVSLAYDPTSGYLRSVLEGLKIAVDSQVLVFSQTSFQAPRIEPKNPRAVFFNDSTAVGWVRGGDLLEVAVLDATKGAVFYTLDQARVERPQLQRSNACVACHLSSDNVGVPGFMVLSTFPMIDDPNAYAGGFTSNHRHPLAQRWGGWYVTGRSPIKHLGNAPVLLPPEGDTSEAKRGAPLDTVSGEFDTRGYPSVHSDIVALMLLEHQTHLANLLTRLGWEARIGSPSARVLDAASDLVDYMLFVDEEPIPGPIKGSSGFAERFAAEGPADSKGRSLRQFDLTRRLMRYPCSYMIYTEAFDALPARAKDAVYARMWQILSGQESRKDYERITPDDRRAIVEILRDTKKDLPEYFR
jgi:hypothetical protein